MITQFVIIILKTEKRNIIIILFEPLQLSSIFLHYRLFDGTVGGRKRVHFFPVSVPFLEDEGLTHLSTSQVNLGLQLLKFMNIYMKKIASVLLYLNDSLRT